MTTAQPSQPFSFMTQQLAQVEAYMREQERQVAAARARVAELEHDKNELRRTAEHLHHVIANAVRTAQAFLTTHPWPPPPLQQPPPSSPELDDSANEEEEGNADEPAPKRQHGEPPACDWLAMVMQRGGPSRVALAREHLPCTGELQLCHSGDGTHTAYVCDAHLCGGDDPHCTLIVRTDARAIRRKMSRCNVCEKTATTAAPDMDDANDSDATTGPVAAALKNRRKGGKSKRDDE